MIILATIAVRCIVFWNVFVRCDIFLFGFYSSSHFFNTLYYLSLWQINVSMYKTQQKPNCQISVSGIAMGSLVTWAWLFQMQHFRRFSSAAVPYIVFSTIGLLSDNCASVHIGNISTYWFFLCFLLNLSNSSDLESDVDLTTVGPMPSEPQHRAPKRKHESKHKKSKHKKHHKKWVE